MFPKHNDEQDVSYDVESLFTSIPLQDTINYILNEIYVNKTIKPFCQKKLIFKNLFTLVNKRLFVFREQYFI